MIAMCEETRGEWTQARADHIAMLNRSEGKIVEVAPRTEATSKPLTSTWVNSQHDDGTLKSRWTTRSYEQQLAGGQNFFATTQPLTHLKLMLVDAARNGHKADIGDCSGTCYQAPLDPTGQESKVYIEAPHEANLGPDYVWDAVSAFPNPKEHPKT